MKPFIGYLIIAFIVGVWCGVAGMVVEVYLGRLKGRTMDGQQITMGDGRQFEILEPAWWRLDRQLLRLWNRDSIKVLCSDGVLTYRVRQVKQKPSRLIALAALYYARAVKVRAGGALEALSALDRSSFGSADAMRIREQAPKGAVDSVMQRVEQLDREKNGKAQ
jgi:hypothetical protein